MREREFASFSFEVAQVASNGKIMEGYASVFNYPIESGPNQRTFVRPGAFKKTLNENRSQIQVLVNHGMDPRYGLLPIGKARVLQEDSTGLWAEVDLHDGPDNDNIKAALASGSLRSQSIQFETMQESFNDDRSERNIEQVKLWEFGPVTFPANEAATASIHSLAAIATLLGEGQLVDGQTLARITRDELLKLREVHWDGAAAMRSCDTAGEFRQIAFERSNDSDPDTAAHWALPHHPRPGAGPDAGGVAAALAALHGGRGGAPDLVMSVTAVENHLERHQAEASSAGDRATEEAGTSPDVDRLTRMAKYHATHEVTRQAWQSWVKETEWKSKN